MAQFNGGLLMVIAPLFLMLLISMVSVDCKHFERCELAHELLKLKVPRQDLTTYMCIVEGESSFNSGAVNRHNNDGSSDHGLFQFNDHYWCQAQGFSSNECKIDCGKLTDDDISDDVRCALHVQRAHGFRAWVVYESRCSGRDLNHYIAGCGL